jgi:hypothetical protein
MDECIERAGVQNLTEWGVRINYDMGRALSHPAARLLPAQVVQLIGEMAAMLGVMARKIEKLEGVQK